MPASQHPPGLHLYDVHTPPLGSVSPGVPLTNTTSRNRVKAFPKGTIAGALAPEVALPSC